MTQVTGNSLAEVLGKINAGAATAMGVIQAVKTMRDMAKALFPDAPEGTFPTDAELIQTLVTEAGLLKSESQALIAWLESLPKQQPDHQDHPEGTDDGA